MHVTPIAYIALLGWIPCVLVMFASMPARKAAAIGVIGGWLLLPPFTLAISGLPDYSKITAASLGIMLGTMTFGLDRFVNFRPRWFDLPILLYCNCGIITSLQNGLGLYDGLADGLANTLTWGLPYLVGRLYFGNPDGLNYFAFAMVVGGLGYVLPCIFEMRMSPVIMNKVYGDVGVWHSMRLGGYRPSVFFRTGLELGMWMTAAAMAGWWLWRCGAARKIGQIPFGSVLLPILLITTIFCRSTGALALLFMGMVVLWLSVRFGTRLLLIGFILIGPIYVYVRVTDTWSGKQAVDLADYLVGPERAESLAYRFMCEDLLLERALQQPVFGWGGWSRSAVYFDAGKPWQKSVPTDGLWIIILGTKGYVGLGLFYLVLILPASLFIWRFAPRRWGEPQTAACSLAAVLLGLYLIDCLMNGFPNIIYVTLAGGLIGVEPKHLRAIAPKTHAGESAHRRLAGDTSRQSAIGVGSTARTNPIVLADRYRSLGRSFKEEGRPDDAESAWRQALGTLTSLMETEPGAPGLRRLWCDCANDLAWLRANHPDPTQRDPASAVAMARRMVAEYPDSETYWNTLGVAYYRAGDDAAAIAALDQATVLGGGTAFDDIFLALAHSRQGDLEAAQLAFQRALTRGERDYPGHPELAGFCMEARSILGNSPSAAAAVH